MNRNRITTPVTPVGSNELLCKVRPSVIQVEVLEKLKIKTIETA